MIGIKNKLDFAKEKTFFISGLGIEVMGEDIGKASYSSALQAQEEGSSEGWRLPNGDECFALWSLKQQGTGNIKDYYYWTSVPHFKIGTAYKFKMDKPFLGTRSKQDYYFIRLVRNV